MIAELKHIPAKLSKRAFPLIPIHYYPNTKHNLPKPKDLPGRGSPCHHTRGVTKVGTSHMGHGKMKFKDNDFSYFSTLTAMYSDYIMTKLFVPNVGNACPED